MKELKELLGLPANATEEKVVNALKELIKEHEAQCELGTEYSKLRGTLAELLGSENFIGEISSLIETAGTVEGLQTQIAELEQKAKDLQEKVDEFSKGDANEMIEALKAEIKELKLGKVEGKLTKDAIDSLVKEAFELNPKVKKFFGTEDGHLFQNESDAFDHRKELGGEVKTYTR